MNDTHRPAALVLASLLLASAPAGAENAGETEATPGAQPPAAKHFRTRGPIDLTKVNEQASRAYAALDTNGDGQITTEEFATAEPRRDGFGPPRFHGRRHGHVEVSTAELFSRLDANGDGQLSSEEFQSIESARRELERQAAFAQLDANDDGVLGRDEFPPFVASLAALDADGDGQVTRLEMRAGRGKKPAAPTEE